MSYLLRLRGGDRRSGNSELRELEVGVKVKVKVKKIVVVREFRGREEVSGDRGRCKVDGGGK